MRRILYYICRDVPAGQTFTSYKPGRTVCGAGYPTRLEAGRVCQLWNAKRNVTTFAYVVVPHEETELLEADFYEN